MAVRRILVLLAFVFTSGTAMAEAELLGDQADGEDAYAASCARCHASVARTLRRIGGGTSEEKAERLDVFLADHYAPDATTRADLIAFLLAE
jgi:hypothetical protein